MAVRHAHMHPWYDVMRVEIYLSGVLIPKNPYPQPNYEKARQIPNEEHSTVYLTNTPEHCQGHQKQGKSEKPSQPTGALEDMTTECDGASGTGSCMGSAERERTLGKN